MECDLKKEGHSLQDPKEVKTKWDSLRDKFVKANQRAEKATKSGAGADKQPKWPYWHQMSWLKDHLQKKRTIGNVHADEEPEADVTTETIEEDDCEPSTSSQGQTTPAVKKLKRKTSIDSATIDLASHIGELAAYMKSTRPAQPATTVAAESGDDDEQRFATMISAQYRMLNPEQRSYFRLKVQRLYVEAMEYTSSSEVEMTYRF